MNQKKKKKKERDVLYLILILSEVFIEKLVLKIYYKMSRGTRVSASMETNYQ